MPNWCENNLRIHGDAEDMKPFIMKLSNSEDPTPLLSFDSLLPMPAHEKDNWYDWRIDNWGTKWDITEDDKGVYPTDETEEYLEYTFSTAWSPPVEFIETISRDFPGLTFQLTYAESGVCFAGSLEVTDSAITNQEEVTTMEEVNAIAEDFFGVTYYDEADMEEEEVQ